MATITETAKAISNVFQEIDLATAAFQLASGMRCINGCGECCRSPQVEVTTTEMIPMALKVVNEGSEDLWLEALAKKEDPVCIFFQPGKGVAGGSCLRYHERPTICRLFGFAGSKSKQGETRYSACKLMKADQPDTFAQANERITQGTLMPPLFSAYNLSVSEAAPGFDNRLQPINKAFKDALELVLYRAYLEREDAKAFLHSDPQSEEPLHA